METPEGAAPVQPLIIEPFSSTDLNLIRQWFNAVQDVTPQFLDANDYRLAIRIMGMTGFPIYDSMRVKAR